MTEPTRQLEGFRRKPIARRVLAVALTAAIAATGSVLAAAPAQAVKPTGSAVELLVQSRDPSAALLSGTWSNGGKSLFTVAGTPSGPAAVSALGCNVGDGIGQAFTLASADGSAEEPVVPSATTVASDVFGWGYGPGYSFVSQPQGDGRVSSLGVNAYDYLYDKALSQKVLDGGEDTSITLGEQWPAGTLISVVDFCSPGIDSAKQEPIVSRDASGHAIASWLKFRTVADPAEPSRTSQNFVVVAPVAPTVDLDATFTAEGTGGTATARLTGSTGAALTDATGSVAFYAGNSTTGTPIATDTSVVNGVASVPLSGLTPGSTVTYTAVYTPDDSLVDKYTSSTSDTNTFEIVAAASTTTLAVSGTMAEGNSQTLTASVRPATATGTVRFFDGTTILGESAVTSGSAQLTRALGVGGHSITAQFVPGNASYKASVSAASSVTVAAAPVQQPDPTPTDSSSPSPAPSSSTPVTTTTTTTPAVIKPAAKAVAKSVVKVSKSKAVVKRTVLKATVTITVAGSKVAPTGKVVITVNGKKVKTVTVKASNKGKVTVALPKFTKVNAKTKIVASYAGTSTIAAAKSKTVAVKVTAK